MAKDNQAKDPTEAALSAIEQALNLTALDSRAATARKLPDSC